MTLDRATCLARPTRRLSRAFWWKHASFTSRALLPAPQGAPARVHYSFYETRWQGDRLFTGVVYGDGSVYEGQDADIRVAGWELEANTATEQPVSVSGTLPYPIQDVDWAELFALFMFLRIAREACERRGSWLMWLSHAWLIGLRALVLRGSDVTVATFGFLGVSSERLLDDACVRDPGPCRCQRLRPSGDEDTRLSIAPQGALHALQHPERSTCGGCPGAPGARAHGAALQIRLDGSAGDRIVDLLRGGKEWKTGHHFRRVFHSTAS